MIHVRLKNNHLVYGNAYNINGFNPDRADWVHKIEQRSDLFSDLEVKTRSGDWIGLDIAIDQGIVVAVDVYQALKLA